MKMALATTTIHIPVALSVFRKLDEGVRFFVAGDLKTVNGAQEFCEQLGNCVYLPPRDQEKWKVSEHLSWNTITRRGIAVLEALAWGADIIICWDDDNLAMGDYFTDVRRAFVPEFSQLEASSSQGWFDAGQLLIPTAKHRGFPIQVKPDLQITPVIDAKVGVAAGICMGDPDIDAVTRIAQNPIVHQVSELLRAGIVTDPRKTRTVFNTQNTAFIRELAPAMFCAPGLGRFDDIYASLITQRIMAEKNLYVHFGQPFVWQQRNPHNLCKDLRAEIDGMENVQQFAEMLAQMKFTEQRSVLNCVHDIYEETRRHSWLPLGLIGPVEAWLQDCETVL